MDLISREVLIKDINMIEVNRPYDDKEDILEKVIATIDRQLTVEAVPVVHGEWIAQDESLTIFKCSVCNGKNHGGHEKFCPDCGADMRKKVKE